MRSKNRGYNQFNVMQVLTVRKTFMLVPIIPNAMGRGGYFPPNHSYLRMLKEIKAANPVHNLTWRVLLCSSPDTYYLIRTKGGEMYLY